MENTKPMVSVIMPAYNAEPYIEAAIRSVQDQTLKNWELLVIDDGSRDQTCAVVRKLAAEDGRITLVENGKNQGVSKVRNQGIGLSRGDFVALLDSDDIWYPDKLKKQVDLLKNNEGDFCFSAYRFIDSKGELTGKTYAVPPNICYHDLLKQNVIGCSTVVLRADVIKKNPFRTDFFHEDYVLWLTLLQQGAKAVGCTEPLVSWRYAENSRSFDKRKSAGNRWRIYRDYLGLSLGKSVYYFICYAVAGLKKYG